MSDWNLSANEVIQVPTDFRFYHLKHPIMIAVRKILIFGVKSDTEPIK